MSSSCRIFFVLVHLSTARRIILLRRAPAEKNSVACIGGWGAMWLGHFPLLILNRGQHLLYLTDNMGTDCYISSSFFARSPRQEPFFGIHKHTIPTEPIYNMSNHTLSPQNGVHSSSEDRIKAAIVEVRRIADWQPSMSESLEQCLYIARAAIRTFDSTGFT